MSPALSDPSVGHLDADARAFLAGALIASATAQAEQAFVEARGLAAISGRTPEEVAARLEARGTALMDLWADLMACTGQDREPWARVAALGAVRIYAGRLGELMAASIEGGRG